MSIKDDLLSKINNGNIIFDPPPAVSARLRSQLLGENSGTQVTELLQKLVLEVCGLKNIRISSIVRDAGHHGRGRAFDVGNEDIAAALLPNIATDARVAALGIDEIIFDASVAGESDRNKWNYDQGQRHNFDNSTLDAHRNHIHFAVKAS